MPRGPTPAGASTAGPAPGGPVGVPPGGAGVEERLASTGLICKLPAGWVEEAPSSNMRLGQARLPRAEGDAEDGEVSISIAAGSVDANVNRWSGQFVEKPAPVVSEKKIGDVQVTLAEMDGTFSSGGPMMKAAGGPKPGTKLIGAIVSIPGSQQLIFFKAWGPRATMERWKPSFDELVSSFRKG